MKKEIVLCPSPSKDAARTGDAYKLANASSTGRKPTPQTGLTSTTG
ncbi:hypothetical protein ACWATR_03225 [Nostoc sp. UIC 10890]